RAICNLTKYREYVKPPQDTFFVAFHNPLWKLWETLHFPAIFGRSGKAATRIHSGSVQPRKSFECVRAQGRSRMIAIGRRREVAVRPGAVMPLSLVTRGSRWGPAQAHTMSIETEKELSTEDTARVAANSAAAIELSVVLPCLNEAATLEVCINKAKAAIQREALSAEILVADNGSTDGSQVTSFLHKLRDGYDLVMGNRFKGNIAAGAMPFLHRYLGTPVLTRLARIFFRTPCGDVNCGMRGFRKEAIEGLGLRSLGMEFASEMLVKSSIFGLRIAEIPTDLSLDGRSTPPHLRTWRDGWRHLRFMLLYSPRW